MIKLETENLYQSAKWAKQGHSYAMGLKRLMKLGWGKKKKKPEDTKKKKI